MQTNKELIEKFYTAFSKLDYETMQSCYSNNVVFNDPVFGLLNATETFAMWEMLCKKAQSFSLTFSNIELLDDEYATCQWQATYIFSATGKKVVNNIKAHMRILDGKITEHSDAFSLYKWAQMALGIKGWLIGWNSFVQNKIKVGAKKNLLKFMNSKNS